MMASNILSRFLPPAPGEPSIYETLRQQDEASDHWDFEDRAGMALDEENLVAGFHDYELDDALVGASADQATRSRTKSSGKGNSARRTHGNPSIHRAHLDDVDDDVPQSLLIEGNQDVLPASRTLQTGIIPPPVPGPANRGIRAKWQATQEQQRLHQDNLPHHTSPSVLPRGGQSLGMMDPKERALWMWANVENLDNFLKDVYHYFLGNGIWSILLSRILNLLTLAFVYTFSTFLWLCIDYSMIPTSKTMSQILIPQCTKNMPGWYNFATWIVAFFWILKTFEYCWDFRRLRNMQNFYRHLLEISDTDIQTVSWQEVVKRLMSLRDSNPATAAGVKEKHRQFLGSQSKQRMDAHDIANRLMRRDNYLIALINKDILDLTLPIPFLKNRQHFSKTLEWNLNNCILDFIFNEQGQVRSLFLQESQRRILSDSLRRRFIFAGLMNIVCAPFIVFFFLLLYFFRYFNEYQRNPSQIGSRQYTPLAEWKFREFNELWHLFERRINMSHPFASRYLDQFPKDKTVQVAKFVAFVAGALASVLALASVIDPESFLALEITHDRTVLFYLGVFGTVWAVARGIVPEEKLVFDPEYTLNTVTEYTHYMPTHWRNRLHSDEVRVEFASLYKMKLIIFLEGILSVIVTPVILWFSLPKCSDRVVDFFREFTVHVDGLGYVCSFAVFDFKKGGSLATQPNNGGERDLREEFYSTKDDKMLYSMYNFMDHYATNPRSGAPYLPPSSRRSFHAPPTFPGMMSPTLAAEVKGPTIVRANRMDRQPRGPARSIFSGTPAGQHSAQHRTPRFAPTGGRSSPMASMLLDPHNQPSPTSLRPQRKLGSHSRLQTSRMPLDDPLEAEEEGLMENDGPSKGDGSEGAGDESNLGESWKMTRAGNRDEDGEDDTQARNHDRGPGVLGLVAQFARTQTEGRGTGVSI